MKISDEKIVLLTYDLTVDTEDGGRELMERATEDKPLTFMYGMGMMLDAFEKNIYNLQMGDKFSFTLSPEEAYGEYDMQKVVELPKKIFEIDGKFDSERISEGKTIPMIDANGHRLLGAVLEIKSEVVIMDFNHPLAGETLHFDGKVIDIHEPTAEEIAALTQEECSCDCCGDSNEGCGGCS
jgi:FKBP-type peptidyl-prolyl cis-trans isomerase SlyD